MSCQWHSGLPGCHPYSRGAANKRSRALALQPIVSKQAVNGSIEPRPSARPQAPRQPRREEAEVLGPSLASPWRSSPGDPRAQAELRHGLADREPASSPISPTPSISWVSIATTAAIFRRYPGLRTAGPTPPLGHAHNKSRPFRQGAASTTGAAPGFPLLAKLPSCSLSTLRSLFVCLVP